MSQVIGVVLAGGAGRRFGRPKGELVFEGDSLARRAAGVLWPLCASVLVSLARGAENPAPEYPLVEDAEPAGRGPLAGIDAAFRATGDSDLLVLACDYPWMDGEILRRLLLVAEDEHDVVLPTDGAGRDHPLAALWRRRAACRVTEALEEERFKVRGLLVDLVVRRLGPGDYPGRDVDSALLNVNTADDLSRAMSLRGLAGPGGDPAE